MVGDAGVSIFRAPELFFQLMNQLGDLLQPLKLLGKVRYPIKTGINEFFFLTRQQADDLRIENEYLCPVVKSPKEFKGIELSGSAEILLFSCNRSESELETQTFRSTRLASVGGSQQVSKSGIPCRREHRSATGPIGMRACRNFSPLIFCAIVFLIDVFSSDFQVIG